MFWSFRNQSNRQRGCGVWFALVCGCCYCCSSACERKPFNQEEPIVPLHRNKLFLCCTLEIFGKKIKKKERKLMGNTKGACFTQSGRNWTDAITRCKVEYSMSSWELRKAYGLNAPLLDQLQDNKICGEPSSPAWNDCPGQPQEVTWHCSQSCYWNGPI